MNYEKLYKEALNRAKHALNCDINGLVSTDKQLIFSMFPELKESKADRIRKELLDYLNERRIIERLTDTRVKKEWITWLEKQGEYKETLCDKCKREQPSHSCQDITELGRCAVEHEQKSADKAEPKFKVGDWVVYNDANVYIVKKIDYIYIIPRYELENIDGDKLSIPFTADYNLRNWTIQDAKDGDVLAFYSNYRCAIMEQFGVVKQYIGQHGGCDTTFSIYVGVDWENNFQIGGYMGSPDIRPATKEQRDTLFAKMKEVGCVWDAEKKLLKPLFGKYIKLK